MPAEDVARKIQGIWDCRLSSGQWDEAIGIINDYADSRIDEMEHQIYLERNDHKVRQKSLIWTEQKWEEAKARIADLERETLRLRKLGIKERLLRTMPNSGKEWYRAGGDKQCPECRLVYFDHPEDPKLAPCRILCNGDRVKL